MSDRATNAAWRKFAVALAALIPFAAMLAYLAATTPTQTLAPPPPVDTPTAPASEPPKGHTPADLDRMLTDLQADLARNPANVDGWVLLGRTFASAGRWPQARDAFGQALARRPDDPDLHMQLGEVLTLAAAGEVTPAAAAEFAHAPDDPRARYYTALAQAQAGHPDQARAALTALVADAPPNAAWLGLVRAELQTLQTPCQPTAPALPQGASNASALDHLRDRVAAAPLDAESWLALARAYQAAGDHARALDTLSQANAQVANNLDLLLAYGQMLADGMRDDALSPPFVAVMRRVETIDPDQPDALWYLGLDAAAHGDAKAAARRWQRLALLLPAGSDERDAVQKRLQLLP